MNKKVSWGVTISLMAVTAAITFVITMSFSLDLFNSKVSNVKEREEAYTKIGELENFVRAKYYNPIDEEELIASVARGYVAGLHDPYAAYYTAEEYQSFSTEKAGYKVGIGCSVSEEGGYIKINDVYSGSSAEESGLLPGDIVVAVDDTDVLSVGFNAAVDMVKGEENTIVKLTVRRDGEDILIYCTRRKNEIQSVYSELIDNVGYIKITTFNALTAEQFKVAVDTMVTAGAKGLVFDVRNNGGGLLTAVDEMLDYLLPEGDIVVVTDRDGKQEVVLSSDEQQIKLPMVVVTNSNTASAAELFTAGLKDFKGAKQVGVNTYGKGVVQETYILTDGSAIKFTTGTYQTTKSDVYDGIGLKPDFELIASEQAKDIYPQVELEGDSQLKKAFEVMGTIVD